MSITSLDLNAVVSGRTARVGPTQREISDLAARTTMALPSRIVHLGASTHVR